MTTTDGPVETLLQASEGDEVEIDARYYEFASPFEVTSIDEHRWVKPQGGIWRSRSVTVETAGGGGRSTTRTLDVVDGAQPPRIGDYGPVERVEWVGETGPDPVPEADRPDWLERDAREIVADSHHERDLAAVLDTVERQSSLFDVHNRLGYSDIQDTKQLLWELGLRKADGTLEDDATLSARIAELREVYDA